MCKISEKSKNILKYIVETHCVSYARILKSKKYSDLFSEISVAFENFPNLDLNTRIFWILNNLKTYPKCEICGKELVKTKCHPLEGYTTKFCSSKCAHKSLAFKEKMKNALSCYDRQKAMQKRELTCLKKYGCRNVSQNSEIRKKISETFSEKTDADILKTTLKRKATKFARYGDENYFDKNKKQSTIEKKTIENPKYLKNIVEKRKKTCLKLYGCDCAAQRDIAKKNREIAIFKELYEKMMSNEKVLPLFQFDEYFKVKNTQKLKWKCKICGNEFECEANDGHGFLPRCYKCFPKQQPVSNEEKTLVEFIEKLDIEIQTSCRKIIPPYELDIYIPEKKLAIEFDGLFWHSEKADAEVSYHLVKNEMCEKLEIQLIHVFEDEWLFKRKQTENFLKKILGVQNCFKHITNDLCEIIELDDFQTQQFIFENSLTENFKHDVSLGLKFKNEIISLMTFTKIYENSYIVNCYDDKIGFDVKESKKKLLDYFIKNHKTKRLIAFVDRRLRNGEDLKKLGFKFLFAGVPNAYLWNFKNKKQKETLEKSIEISNEEKNMREYTRIYDSGNLVFEKTYF